MAGTGGFFRNILVWTHERGTLQYDIICALIVVFILFVPRSCFTARRAAGTPGSAASKQQAPAPTPPHAKTSNPAK